MFARILLVPLVIVSILFGLLTWKIDEFFVWFLVVSVAGTVLVFMLSPQINWWWYNRHPPDLPEPGAQLLERFCGYYQRLEEAGKLRFRQRVALYLMGVDFIPMVFKKVPEDFKVILAAQAVQLTFHRDDFLLQPFERIVLYPHVFPSPQYPETFHACELFEPDGVLLFSADEVMRGYMTPDQFYHVALHEYAKAFLLTHKGLSLPVPDETIWPSLERISGLSRAKTENCVGLPDIPVLAVCITHFFVFPDTFAQELPELYQQLGQVFMLQS
jgi:hypothetical protein